MGEQFYWLFLGVLAVWRITQLLHAEDGPWAVMVGLRRAAGEGLWGELLDCFYCLSLWVSVPLAIVLSHSWLEFVRLWLGLSGAAILLHRITEPATIPVASFVEDPER